MVNFSRKVKLKTIIIAIAMIITALAGSALSVWQLGDTDIQLKGMLINARLIPSANARTILNIPPFGEVVADTHRGPISLEVSLERVETDAITSSIEKTSGVKGYFSELKNDFAAQIELFFLRQLLIGSIGAAAVLCLVWRLRLMGVMKYTSPVVLILIAVMGASFWGYDLNAFNEPEYMGTLKMAPKAMEIANETLSNLDRLKGQTNVVVGNIRQLFASTQGLPGLNKPDGQNGSFAVLLVSDLHTNPVGVEFMKAIAQQFRVDMVINGGDLSDMGSMPEAGIIADVSSLGITQVIVSGNHDSAAIMERFSEEPDIQIARGTTIQIKGLKILGWPDTLGDSEAFEYEDDEKKKEALERQAEDIAAAVESQGTPDILVVHNESVAKKLVEYAPLVVTGHTHKAHITSQNGHTLINPGTVGAAGFRGLYSESEADYSAAIVYMKPGVGPISCDMIKYRPESGQFSLERQVIDTEEENSPSN